MVKFTDIFIGIILFSLFTTLMFAAASTMGSDYGSRDADQYKSLSGNYSIYVVEGSDDNGTIRKIQAKLSGEKNVISVGSDIITAAVDGVVLFFRSITTTTRITDQIIEDSGGRIDPLFGVAIKSIIVIIILVIVITMIMRSKAET